MGVIAVLALAALAIGVPLAIYKAIPPHDRERQGGGHDTVNACRRHRQQDSVRR